MEIDEYKKKVEAILFVAGRRLSLKELTRLTRIKDIDVMKQALKELKKDYDEKESSLIVEMVEEGDTEYWKLTVTNQMIPLIKKIVSRTELKKSVIETLAYIAYKYPIKQSDLVKVRSNKSYDHLRELEKAGYISRQRYGRTNLIRLTDKFFDYFDLPPEKVKEQFKDFEQLESAIQEKEKEVKEKIEEHRQRQEEANKVSKEEKVEEESLEPDLDQIEIDLVDEGGHKTKLKVFDEELSPEDKIHDFPVKPEITEIEETLGELEVIEEPIEELVKVAKKETEHLGKLNVYGEGTSVKEEGAEEDIEKEAPGEDIFAPEEEVADEEASEEEVVKKDIFAHEEGAEEEGETEVKIKPSEESEIEKEIREQKEELRPQEDAEFGKGFAKPVEEYLDQQAEIRAEEMMHPLPPKKEIQPGEEEEEKPLIEMPAEHKVEIPEEEIPEEDQEDEEKKEELIEKVKEKITAEEEGLPPMDIFEEEDKEESEDKK